MPDIKKNKQSYIPLFLQQKLKNEKGEGSVEGSPGRRPGASKQRRALSVDPQKTFTAPQLEDLIWKTSQTIVELQKQIQRGEETYYEETQSHGSSLFRGFETFIDARDVGTSNVNGRQGEGVAATGMTCACAHLRLTKCINIIRKMKGSVFGCGTQFTSKRDTNAQNVHGSDGDYYGCCASSSFFSSSISKTLPLFVFNQCNRMDAAD